MGTRSHSLGFLQKFASILLPRATIDESKKWTAPIEHDLIVINVSAILGLMPFKAEKYEDDMIDKWGHKIHKTCLTQGSPIRDSKMVVTITAENWLLAANHPICFGQSLPARYGMGLGKSRLYTWDILSLAHHEGSIFCIKTLKKDNQCREATT